VRASIRTVSLLLAERVPSFFVSGVLINALPNSLEFDSIQCLFRVRSALTTVPTSDDCVHHTRRPNHQMSSLHKADQLWQPRLSSTMCCACGKGFPERIEVRWYAALPSRHQFNTAMIGMLQKTSPHKTASVECPLVRTGQLSEVYAILKTEGTISG
jgi:hypothetical protein